MIKIVQFMMGIIGGIFLIAMTCTYLNERFDTFLFTIAAGVLGAWWSVFLFRRLILTPRRRDGIDADDLVNRRQTTKRTN